MKFKHSIFIDRKPADIYSVYENVSGWPTWDLETESASIDGEFAVGTTGKIKPKGAPQSKIKLVEVTPDKSFTVECGLPLCKMSFVHILTEKDQGTDVVNEVNFTGLLAPLFSRMVGKAIDKTIPESLQGLKSFTEK